MKVARLVLGLILFAGLFCPCRGSAFSFPSTDPLERACCETCADEQQGVPDDSNGVPGDCECESGCCAPAFVPDKDDSWDSNAGNPLFSAIPFVSFFDILTSSPELASPAPVLWGATSLGTGSLLPDLGSLLI